MCAARTRQNEIASDRVSSGDDGGAPANSPALYGGSTNQERQAPQHV